jgi:phosphomevalonate kinase
MTTPVEATAPGKLFLSGEWAVLSGAPALVLAVERRARVSVTLTDGGPALVVDSLGEPSAAAGDRVAVEVAFRTIENVAPWLGGRRILVEVDTRPFLEGERKLGLGRSAATLTAATAALLATGGRAETATVLAAALEANAVLQDGHGSGADVAAAVYGGLVEVVVERARRVGDDDGTRTAGRVRVNPRRLPDGLRVLVGWTGTAAPTRPLLERFARTARPAALDAVADAARAAAAAVQAGDAGALSDAVERSAAALERLGSETGVPIVTPALARLVAAARGAGAAAKPSGAGGGDCGIALVDGAGTAERVLAAWREAGVVPLPLAMADEGVRVTTDASVSGFPARSAGRSGHLRSARDSSGSGPKRLARGR